MLSFSGRHYPVSIILQAVRWYVSYALSYRNIEEMMKERGIMVDHTTLNRWVLHYAPLLEQKARKHKRSVHRSWRMDETYIRPKESGGICIVRLINTVQQLNLCSQRSAMPRRLRRYFVRLSAITVCPTVPISIRAGRIEWRLITLINRGF